MSHSTNIREEILFGFTNYLQLVNSLYRCVVVPDPLKHIVLILCAASGPQAHSRVHVN